jgi:hypothetical protein
VSLMWCLALLAPPHPSAADIDPWPMRSGFHILQTFWKFLKIYLSIYVLT